MILIIYAIAMTISTLVLAIVVLKGRVEIRRQKESRDRTIKALISGQDYRTYVSGNKLKEGDIVVFQKGRVIRL